jgi:hypothetical protein
MTEPTSDLVMRHPRHEPLPVSSAIFISCLRRPMYLAHTFSWATGTAVSSSSSKRLYSPEYVE